MDHEVDPRPRRNAELLRRVKNAHQWVHQVYSDLSEANRLEQGAPPTAEWILDKRKRGTLLKNITFKNEMWDVGFETTYLHLKRYKFVIPQSFGLKVF
jgi:hypothetical protein